MADPDRLVPGVVVRVGGIMGTPPWIGTIRDVFLPSLNTDYHPSYYYVLGQHPNQSHFAAVSASQLEIIYGHGQ